MKIKSILVCLLAICAISLSSCKEEKNYAEDFVGTYAMTMTPSITATIPGMGEMPIEDFEAIGGATCTIKETVANTVTVTIVVENIPIPVLVTKGTCDETGMHLEKYNFNQTIPTGEELGDLALNITLGSATVAAPTNGKISWTTTLSGTLGMEMEVMPGVTMPIEAELAGNMTFSGIK